MCCLVGYGCSRLRPWAEPGSRRLDRQEGQVAVVWSCCPHSAVAVLLFAPLHVPSVLTVGFELRLLRLLMFSPELYSCSLGGLVL